MASPEPSGYSHHHQHHQHHNPYSHYEQPPLPPQPLPAQPQQGSMLPDHYSDRPLHYPGHCSLLPTAQHELDQPLDLTVSRSPRPASTESLSGSGDGVAGQGLAKRPRLEEPGLTPPLGRTAAPPPAAALPHSAVCLVKGCGCHNARPAVHHPSFSSSSSSSAAAHSHQSSSSSYSRSHRHSPYPQYSPPGPRSPALGGEAQPPHRLPYPLPRPPSPSSSSSPAAAHVDGSSPSPYFPPPPNSHHHQQQQQQHQDRRCRSPYGSGRLVTSSSSSSSSSSSLSVSPYGGDLMRQGRGPSSPGALLCPPCSSASPLPLAPRPRDNSPRPSSRASSRARDFSPRPAIYRPFEDGSPSSSDMAHSAPAISSSGVGGSVGSVGSSAVERYRHTSEDDLLASSSLLSLSYTSSTGSSRSSSASQQSQPAASEGGAWRGYGGGGSSSRPGGEEELLLAEGSEQGDNKPTQSDAGRAAVFHPRHHHHHHLHHNNLPSTPPPHCFSASSSSTSSSTQPAAPAGAKEVCGQSYADAHSRHPANDYNGSRQLGPAQDPAVVSSSPSSDLTGDTSSTSPSSAAAAAAVGVVPTRAGVNKERSRQLESRIVRVVGSTPLTIARAKRAERQAKLSKERMRQLVERRQERQHHHHAADSNDSEGGGGGSGVGGGGSSSSSSASSDQCSSSSQGSPRSSDGGSEGDVGLGFPIPPDPNLKMSALDYLISEVLVTNIDKPFKPCNTEISEICAGTRKERLTLVHLIELQVEACLKA